MATRIEGLLTGRSIVFEGAVVKKNDAGVTIELHPGFNVELGRDQIESLEEGTDEATGTSFLRVTIKAESDVSAILQPVAFRQAAGAGDGDMPFGLGGDQEQRQADESDARSPAKRWKTDWIGMKDTYCPIHPWGPATPDDRAPAAGWWWDCSKGNNCDEHEH